MKLLNIITAPDLRLTKWAQKVTIFDQNLHNFAKNMIYTMQQKDGCGLASIQVEDDLSFNLTAHSIFRAQPNLIIIKAEKFIITAVNPEILSYSEETDFDKEGCLSLPGEKNLATIERSSYIQVKYNDLNGKEIHQELKDLSARIFQHEYDHNIGKIFPNRLKKSREEFFWTKYLEKKKVL